MSVEQLLKAFPSLAGKVPFVPLGCYPTPVEPLERLSKHLGCNVWVKRDDRSGLLYGGNKVRKLEGLLGAAQAAGCDRILTAGPYGSHHVLAAALYANHLGIRTHALLTPQPLTEHVQRTRRQIDLLCERVVVSRNAVMTPFAAASALFGFYQKASRFSPGIIVPGGASLQGVLGDVGAVFELEDQIMQGQLPRPGAIVVPVGTGGTAIGLAIGLTMIGADTEVWAVRATHRMFSNSFVLGRLASKVLRGMTALGLEAPMHSAVMRKVIIDGSQLGAGYGVPTAGALRSVRQFAQWGLQLEPTYSGKAAASLVLHGSQIDGPLLFWNTFNSRQIQIPAAKQPGLLPPV